jgi:hypothetical protein
VVLVEGPIAFSADDPDTLVNPAVLVQVTTAGAPGYDPGRKFHRYETLPSLREYVVASSDIPLIRHFFRRPAGEWAMRFVDGPDAELALSSVPVRPPLSAIYADVTFPESTPR